MMNLSESHRRIILFSLIVIIISGLITSSVLGKKQDEAFKKDQETYKLGVQQLQEENYEVALQLFEKVIQSQRSSEHANYMLGVAAANTGEMKKAARHMQKTLEINPYRVEDPMFMLHFAQSLVAAERTDEARKVLEKCATLPVPESNPNYMEQVNLLQTLLESQT